MGEVERRDGRAAAGFVDAVFDLFQRLRDQDPAVTPALQRFEELLATQGTTAEETVSFAVDGVEWEIDLSKANAAGMSVPRLLHESAKSAHVETSTERKAAIADLFRLRREVGTIANNVNKLARYANTEGSFPREAEAVVAEFRELYPRIRQAVDRLADS